jgi:hypothetical protein
MVMHDFLLRDQRNQQGQGYSAVYTGIIPYTFCGAGTSPRQNLFDANDRERLWIGGSDGFMYQLEDGSVDDNGQPYTGDWISLINAGHQNTMMDQVQWQGDGEAIFSFSVKPNLAISDWTTPEVEALTPEDGNNRFLSRISQEALWVFGRFQLTSHAGDSSGGTLLVTGEEIPVANYGRISMVTGKMGAARPEAA